MSELPNQTGDDQGESRLRLVLGRFGETRPGANDTHIATCPRCGKDVEIRLAARTSVIIQCLNGCQTPDIMQDLEITGEDLWGKLEPPADRPAPLAAPSLLEVSTHYSDIGNSARLTIHNPDVRYCGPLGVHLLHDGKRWAFDTRNQVLDRAKRTSLSLFAEAEKIASDFERRKLLDHAIRSQKRDRINAMIELAKPDMAIVPDELDCDPDLINTQDGMVDLRTGELRPHRREDYVTKICRAGYNPNVGIDTFLAFLSRIFRTHPSLIPYVQKLLGYCLTGLTSEQVMFFFYGLGANGKSTLLDIVSYVMGDYAGKADRELLRAHDGATHPANVADIMGKRLVWCSETNEGVRIDEGKMKDLTGDRIIKARKMYGDFFQFVATYKLIICSNHKPLVHGIDHGFWRRMRLLPFVETITDDEKDTELFEKMKVEADGILAWMVAGCLLWRREGLGFPDEVAQATNTYRQEQDSIGSYLAECCLRGDKFEAAAKDMYASYVGWCEDGGERPLSQKRFGMSLAERGFTSDRDSITGRKKWVGIGLKADPNKSQTQKPEGLWYEKD